MKWIQQREEDRGLVTKAFTDDYMKYLELAIQYGKPFLFESVEADIDPSIDPVLERNLVMQNGQKIVMLCERDASSGVRLQWGGSASLAPPNSQTIDST